MNSNIEDLAYQAADKTKFFSPLAEWEQASEFLQIFAELLIRECTLEVNRYIVDMDGAIRSLPEHVLQDRFEI